MERMQWKPHFLRELWPDEKKAALATLESWTGQRKYIPMIMHRCVCTGVNVCGMRFGIASGWPGHFMEDFAADGCLLCRG